MTTKQLNTFPDLARKDCSSFLQTFWQALSFSTHFVFVFGCIIAPLCLSLNKMHFQYYNDDTTN